MKIRIQPQKTRAVSQELLDLSKKLRRYRFEIDEVRRNLRHHSDLEPCRRELLRQVEMAELETARVVKLAAALAEISKYCEQTEERNGDEMEGVKARGRSGWFQTGVADLTPVRSTIRDMLD